MVYTNDNDDGKSEDRESTEDAPANDVDLEKTRSITRWLDTSDHSDEPDTFPKARRSDTSKENENTGIYENTSHENFSETQFFYIRNDFEGLRQ